MRIRKVVLCQKKIPCWRIRPFLPTVVVRHNLIRCLVWRFSDYLLFVYFIVFDGKTNTIYSIHCYTCSSGPAMHDAKKRLNVNKVENIFDSKVWVTVGEDNLYLNV